MFKQLTVLSMEVMDKLFQGEMKQNRWVEQVTRAIKNVCDADLKQLLEQIQGFENIPRKEAKFINFLQNSVKVRNRSLCIRVSSINVSLNSVCMSVTFCSRSEEE